MREIGGKVAVVTGGGSGIGRGIALALADGGMDVVLADVDDGAAAKVAKEVEGHGRRALVVKTDVSDFTAVERPADPAYAEVGAVHVLCNNPRGLVARPPAALRPPARPRGFSVYG